MISIIIALAAAQVQPASRAYEGDWYVSDSTDNNTGEREVYAFQTYLKRGETDYVTLTMRCSAGKPTFFVEWEDLPFPDQTVVTIGPVVVPNAEPAEEGYVFQKSEDVMERGLRASPDISAKIVSAIGQAKYATVTAHLASGTRTVGMNVGGAQKAWRRVSRHCPVQKVPMPPL